MYPPKNGATDSPTEREALSKAVYRPTLSGKRAEIIAKLELMAIVLPKEAKVRLIMAKTRKMNL